MEHCRHLSEERYYRKGKNDKHYRLTKTLKPLPTIFNPYIQTWQCSSSSHIIYPVTVPRRSPIKRIYQDDQYQSFMNYDLINKLSGIEESLSLVGFLLKKNNDYITFYKSNLVKNARLKLHNALKLTRNYMWSSSFKAVQFLITVVSPRHWLSSKKKKQKTFQYTLELTLMITLRYLRSYSSWDIVCCYDTYLSSGTKSYFKYFPLSSLSLLQKISSGTIDAVICANALRIEENISEDICMIFDEMYLWKSQEHFGGEMIGCDDCIRV